MKTILLTLSLFYLISLHAQDNNNNKIIIGTIDSVSSKILGEQRKIWCMFLTAGIKHYFSTTTLPGGLSFRWRCALLFSNGNDTTIERSKWQYSLPEMIVVGIPNTDRTRDLTPTHVTSGPYVDSNFVRTTGGGEKFTDFH